jgi:hypothetical protein
MSVFGMGKVETVALMANQGKRIRTPDTILTGIAGGAEDSKSHSSLDRRKETCKPPQLLSILE